MEYFHQLLCKKSHPSHVWNTLKLAAASLAPPENWPSFNLNIAGRVVISYPCVLLSTPPLLVLFSRPLGSVPLSSLFTKVEIVPHPRTTVPSLFSQFLVKFSRSMFISSFHNIFTPTTCSILFSLDSTLHTQTKLFFSTALTSGIRPLTPRSMWVQCSSTFPRPSTLSATSYFYPNSPT